MESDFFDDCGDAEYTVDVAQTSPGKDVTMQEERRKWSRFSIKGKGKIELKSQGKDSIQAPGVNLSRSGILFNTEGAVDRSTEVSVRMELEAPESNEQIELDGVVVRSDQGAGTYDTAVSFTGVPEEHRNKLDEFLKSVEISSGDDQFLDVPE